MILNYVFKFDDIKLRLFKIQKLGDLVVENLVVVDYETKL